MKLLVRTSFWLVILFTLISIVLDIQVWSMVFYKGVPGSAHQTMISQIGRFLRTALMLAFIPAILNSPAKRQARLLVLALFMAVVADYFLILRQQLIVGIGIFGLMQIVLMLRHLAGFQLKLLAQKPFLTLGLIGLAVCYAPFMGGTAGCRPPGACNGVWLFVDQLGLGSFCLITS